MMEYRINKRTKDKISMLGFGTSYIAQAGEKDVYKRQHSDRPPHGLPVEQYGLRCVMKIFVNRKIKTLFCSVLLAIAVFSLISAACAGLGLKNAAFCVLLSSAGMGLLVFTAMYLY